MNVGFILRKLFDPRFLLISLIFVLTSFFLSQYISRNYGLPQWITIQVKTEKRILLGVYYDIGKGYDEKYKVSQWINGSDDFQTVKLKLPASRLRSFRIDPLSEPGALYIKSIKLSSLFGKYHLWSVSDIHKDFRPYDISRFELVNDFLLVESIGSDPFIFTAAPIPSANEISTVKIIIVAFSLFLSFFC